MVNIFNVIEKREQFTREQINGSCWEAFVRSRPDYINRKNDLNENWKSYFVRPEQCTLKEKVEKVIAPLTVEECLTAFFRDNVNKYMENPNCQNPNAYDMYTICYYKEDGTFLTQCASTWDPVQLSYTDWIRKSELYDLRRYLYKYKTIIITTNMLEFAYFPVAKFTYKPESTLMDFFTNPNNCNEFWHAEKMLLEDIPPNVLESVCTEYQTHIQSKSQKLNDQKQWFKQMLLNRLKTNGDLWNDKDFLAKINNLEQAIGHHATITALDDALMEVHEKLNGLIEDPVKGFKKRFKGEEND